MHISAVDLNLLVVAAALYRTHNVSKAAQELGLSQSAVSHALARLRGHFGNPMFVRVARGVAPTELARSMQGEIVDIVRRSELLLSRRRRFDPREARARITLATNDYFEVVGLAPLFELLSREAPGVHLSVRPTGGELPKRELEEGRVDFAIAGFYESLPEGYYQSRLLTYGFSVAARKDHPLAHGKLGVEQYYSARHALITLQGDFRDPIEHRVGRRRLEREIAYGSYSFSSLAWILSETDLLLTAPTPLLERYREYFPLRLWPCPIDVGTAELKLIWHAQTHEDPLRRWLRQQLSRSVKQLTRRP